MRRRISLYLLTIKIICLAVSILFLIQGIVAKKDVSHVDSTTKLFVVDRHKNTTDQIAMIESYLATSTGQAVALATYASGETTLLIPATQDYTLYRAYLRTISYIGNESNELQEPPMADGGKII